MVPLGVYKFEAYEGSTFLRKITVWAPLRKAHSGEPYSVDGNSGQMSVGIMQVFGKIPNSTYDSDIALPPTIYPQIPARQVVGFPQSAPFSWNDYIGRTIDLYLDKDAYMKIRVIATLTTGDNSRNLDVDYIYIRGGQEIFRITHPVMSQYYRSQWGIYIGIFDSMYLLPLPDFEQLNLSSTSYGLCAPTFNGIARYTTISTTPTAEPYQVRVNCEAVYQSKENVERWLGNYKPEYPDDDNPFWEDDQPDEGGGDDQNFDDDTDDVDEDEMPDLSAIGTGFATLFTPTRSQLRYLADVMWGSAWWQALQNMVEGIDKMFVSLGIMPFVVSPGATVEVTWLGLALTEVTLTLAASQYYEFDMGSIDLSNDSRIWTSDSAMDYAPFCKLGIYLPFIGFQEINIDECRRKVISLKYRIDALSGSCVALVKVDGNTIYQFTGNCMVQIPITSQSFDEFISTVTNVAIAGANAKTASAIAGGGDKAAESALRHAESGLASATANAISGL